MQVRVMTQLLFDAVNAWSCVDTIKLDSEKEQDSQSLLQMDPANLATLLSLSCTIPTKHDSKHFSMAIRNVAPRMFAWWATFDNDNALQEWMHYVLWPNKHNPPQQFSLDAKWRIIGHCNAYHTVLTSAMHVIQNYTELNLG
jgi:hypothetical protein